MTTLIEDMARAIAEVICVPPGSTCETCAEAALQVVLASLREPSEGVIKAGTNLMPHHGDNPSGAWQAMLSQWEKENV